MSVIEVVSYNPQWPQIFRDEAEIIKQVLGDECLAVHHIGSTAVPGLSAKPIIDMIVVTKDHTPCIEPLKSIGYQYEGEYNLPFRQYFSKNGCVKFHIHAYTEGHTEIALNLLFTQYLIAHPDVKKDYGLLKSNLIQQQQSHEKNNSAFSGYTLGKYQFIQQTLQQAGFDKKRMLHCTHPLEWQAVKHLRQKHFFDKAGTIDPYTWTFDHHQHVHLILYVGIDIVGYAHIQLWPHARTVLRTLIIDTPFQNKDYGQYFLNQLEKWLKHRGYLSLHTQASHPALPFYEKNNYQRMAFNDPDDYPTDPKDTTMGKIL